MRFCAAGVDRAGLLPSLVDGEDQAPVLQLLVDLGRGGGEEQHHRPLDPVLLGHQASRLRVLARASDRELAFGLQELQRVGRARAPSSSTIARTCASGSCFPCRKAIDPVIAQYLIRSSSGTWRASRP